MTRGKSLQVLNTDKCFPNVSDRLVKSVDIELGFEGLMEIHLGDELGNTGREVGRERTNRESTVSSKQLLGGGKSQGLCHRGCK